MSVETRDQVASLVKKKRSAYGQWVIAALAVLILAFLVIGFIRGNINWGTVGKYLFSKGILDGLINTVWMTFAAMAVGIVLGTLLAVMRILPNAVLQSISKFYIWLFRGIPQLLQLYLWYNLGLIFPNIGIPGVLSFDTVDVMTPLLATALGLGLCQAAYTSEVVRAGILSVDQGQIEAAESIGMGSGKVLWRIILPQAMRIIIPPIGNEFISMVKLTSLASVIQFTEILYNAQTVYFVNGQVMELLIVATVWYLVVVTVLTMLQSRIEDHFSKGIARPAQRRTPKKAKDKVGA